MATKKYFWHGDSGDTFTVSYTGKGTERISITSDANRTIDARQKQIQLRTNDLTKTVTLTVKQSGGKETLSISSDTVNLPNTGTAATLTITSNTDWSIDTSNLSWSDTDKITVTPTSGQKGSTEISISATANKLVSSRTKQFTVKTKQNTVTETVTVNQAGANESLVVSVSELVFDKTGGSKTFTITANTDWSITTDGKLSDDAVYEVTPKSGKPGTTATVTVRVPTNLSLSERNDTITVKSGSLTKNVVVKQTAASGTLTMTPNEIIRFDQKTGKPVRTESYRITGDVYAIPAKVYETKWPDSNDKITITVTSVNSTTVDLKAESYANNSKFDRNATYELVSANGVSKIAIKFSQPQLPGDFNNDFNEDFFI